MGDTSYRALKIFDEFEKIEQRIGRLLLKDFDLMRLLYYTDNDPLSMPMNEELADLILTESFSTYDDEGRLQYRKNPDNRISFEVWDSDAITDSISFLRIFPIQYNPDNVYMGTMFIQVDIVVHEVLSKMQGGRRRNKIAKQVINTLNNKDMGVGISPLAIVDRPITLVQFKNNYWGYSIMFQINISGGGLIC